MPDIFDEVSEDLRAERAQKLLKQYGGLMIGAALVVLAATGAWKGWQWHQARETARVASTFISALRTAERPAGPERAPAMPELEKVAAEGGAGYRALARLREAALNADSGNLPTALAQWDQVAADRDADPLLRDIASLMWVTRQIDTADTALLEARLAPLATPDHALRALAIEAQALIALRQGRTDAARDSFKRLSQDVTTPDGVRGRANGVLAQIGGAPAP